ncbi:MAG: hypothetical protein IPM66_09130 [Acidobacteriota bacterium]|nr:MAG: hypothetical protein IPM66_09130 [Acidobacteriota bacterium]
MRFLKFHIVAILLLAATVASAQQPTKIKRPVKNPPQFPNIIDLDDKAKPATEEKAEPEAPLQSEALARAIEGLTGELKTLVLEVRSLNLRQQAQLDMLRLTRIDLRVDLYDRELRPVRDRINALAAEEQNIYRLMTPESLVAQTANVSTLSRDKTIEQMKLNYQARLDQIKAEQERLKSLESDLTSSLSAFQKLGAEADRRIVEAEEMLRQIEKK